MKTYIVSTILALATLPASAGITSPDDQLRTFATCAGRLSAQMEWQWMFDGPGSEVTQAQRAALIDLLMSVLPEGRGPEVFAWQVDAKAAHSALLTRATFADDAADAAWAGDMAQRLVADCTGFLLS